MQEERTDKVLDLLDKLTTSIAKKNPRYKEYFENEKEEAQQTIQNINPSDLIGLNFTPKQNKHIIELIHSYLNYKLFRTELKQFERHFIDNGIEFKQTQWKGGTAQIKALFDLLEGKEKKHLDIPLITTHKVNKLITIHFINKVGKPFTEKRISAERGKLTYYFENQKYLPELAEKLKKLVQTFN